MESYRATRSSDMGCCRADQRDRITLVDQHVATDRQIAVSGSGKLAGVALNELDVGVAGGAGARARGNNGGSIAIDGNDGAGRAHDLGSEERNIADTQPKSTTRMPGASPASRKSRVVIGLRFSACSIRRRSSCLE